MRDTEHLTPIVSMCPLCAIIGARSAVLCAPKNVGAICFVTCPLSSAQFGRRVDTADVVTLVHYFNFWLFCILGFANHTTAVPESKTLYLFIGVRTMMLASLCGPFFSPGVGEKISEPRSRKGYQDEGKQTAKTKKKGRLGCRRYLLGQHRGTKARTGLHR